MGTSETWEGGEVSSADNEIRSGWMTTRDTELSDASEAGRSRLDRSSEVWLPRRPAFSSLPAAASGDASAR